MDASKLVREMMPGGAGSRIATMFDRMEVAEQVLREHGLSRHPWAFLAMRPGPALGEQTLDPRVYRAHARELAKRIKAGEPTAPATAAEVLVAMSRASLAAPPSGAFSRLMTRLFVEVMGPRPGVVEESGREDWPGQLAEDLAEARRRGAQDWRSEKELTYEKKRLEGD